MPSEFLDTNVLVYAFSTDRRSAVAEELLSRGCAVGVQGLNEFANVARRKLGMSWAETTEAVQAIQRLSPVLLPLDLETHRSALDLAERYALAMFDASMLAAALQGGCSTFWSEDMQDGLVIDGRLRISNPFAK